MAPLEKLLNYEYNPGPAFTGVSFSDSLKLGKRKYPEKHDQVKNKLRAGGRQHSKCWKISELQYNPG